MFGFTLIFPTISQVSHQSSYLPRPRPIFMIFSALMFGDVHSMSLIQDCKMGRRFPSGFINHIWAILYILLIWSMSATFLLVKCHQSIIRSLMICLKLYLALAMMPCLMIFATISLTLIAIFIFLMTSSSLMTLIFIICLFLMKCG